MSDSVAFGVVEGGADVLVGEPPLDVHAVVSSNAAETIEAASK
ncbi:MAG: hypothetical protein ABSA93_23710 [Streptosporangiaceae bacterium]